MSERGVFAFDRGIWDHPVFADEPFTEREAWAWLISEASFRSRKKRIGSTVFDLGRGQLACSLRFMAEAWQWKKDAVARFLNKLRTETMIETQARHDATVITICKYDVYQKVSLPAIHETETPNETPTRHQRDKLEETKNTKQIDRIAEQRASIFTEGSKALASAFWKALGFESPLQVPPEFAGVDWRAVGWENAGWTVDLIETEARRIGPDKPLSYHEKVFATTFAKRQAPLPIVEIREAEKVVTYGAVKPKGGSILAAIDRQLAELSQENPDLAAPAYPVLRISR